MEDQVSDAVAVRVDFAKLLQCMEEHIDKNLRVNLSIALDMQPKEAIACLAAASHQVRTSSWFLPIYVSCKFESMTAM